MISRGFILVSFLILLTTCDVDVMVRLLQDKFLDNYSCTINLDRPETPCHFNLTFCVKGNFSIDCQTYGPEFYQNLYSHRGVAMVENENDYYFLWKTYLTLSLNGVEDFRFDLTTLPRNMRDLQKWQALYTKGLVVETQLKCSDGYHGENCVSIPHVRLGNETSCNSIQCKNFGKCINQTCQCVHGFTGEFCETEILECASQPCINGQCEDLLGMYHCSCFEGYTGQNCEAFLQSGNQIGYNNICAPCFANNTCFTEVNITQNNGSNGCPENLYGKTCNVYCSPKDSCLEGHYDCNSKTGSKICKPGWGGVNCDERNVSKTCDRECPEIKCKNDGQCFKGVCCCPSGYTGLYCEEQMVFCDNSHCLNGGTCVYKNYSIECICYDAYSGPRCEHLTTTSQRPTTNSFGDKTTMVTSTVTTAKTKQQTRKTTKMMTTISSTKTLITREKTTKATTTTMPPLTTTTPTTTESTTGTTTTTTTTKQTTTTKPTSMPPDNIFTIYITGDLSRVEKNNLGNILSKATQQSSQNINCTIHIVNVTALVDTAIDFGSLVTKVDYKLKNCSNNTDPTFWNNFLPLLDKILNSNQPTSNHTIFSGSHNFYINIGKTSPLNIVGYVSQNDYGQIEEKLENVLQKSNSGSGRVKVRLVGLEPRIGTYGIQLSTFYYVALSGGLMEMKLKQPSNDEFRQEFDGTMVLYQNNKTYSYANAQRKLKIQEWNQHLEKNITAEITNGVPGNAETLFAHYELSTDVSNKHAVEYVIFPLSKNSMVSNSLANPGSRRLVYIDVHGRIKIDKRSAVIRALAGPTLLSNRDCVAFQRQCKWDQFYIQHRLTSNDTEVSRLWYIPESTYIDRHRWWPHPNIYDNFDKLKKDLLQYNFSVTTSPSKMIFQIFLMGNQPKTSKNSLTTALHKSWLAANHEILTLDLVITISNWKNDYIDKDSKQQQLTLVVYHVTILGADYSYTNAMFPEYEQISKSVESEGLQTCQCVGLRRRSIHLVGNISQTTEAELMMLISDTWRRSNMDADGNFTVKAQILSLLSGFETSTGESASLLEYYILPYIDGNLIGEEDLNEPTIKELNSVLQNKIPDLEITTTEIRKSENLSAKKKKENNESWLIPVVAVACAAALALLIGGVVVYYRTHGQKGSLTFKQKPEEITDYDKQNFSQEPDVDHTNGYGTDSYTNDSKNKNTYFVNQ